MGQLVAEDLGGFADAAALGEGGVIEGFGVMPSSPRTFSFIQVSHWSCSTVNSTPLWLLCGQPCREAFLDLIAERD